MELNFDLPALRELVYIVNNYQGILTTNTMENLLNKHQNIAPEKLGELRELCEFIKMCERTENPTLRNYANTCKNTIEQYVSQL